MPIVNIFSKRMKQSRGEVPDVYRYDHLPGPLRVQIIQIWERALGRPYRAPREIVDAFRGIVGILCHELGVFTLPFPPRLDLGRDDFYRDLVEYFQTEERVENALDVVELCFSTIERLSRYRTLSRPIPAKVAIDELNYRFREHGVGYAYSDGHIIRKDGEFAHEKIVRPCLQVLAGKAYGGAQEEFLKGEKYYRKGDMKGAVTECQKAVESVMKVICKKRGWAHGKHPTAKELISTLLANGLIPSFWQNHLASLRSLLEGGSALVRNRLSAHGQGTETVEIPRHLAAYTLHMAAATILFLAEAEASGAGK